MPSDTKIKKKANSRYSSAFVAEVENTYLTDWINDYSLEEIAEKYDISFSTIASWSTKYNWDKKKRRVRAELWEQYQRKQFTGEGLEDEQKIKNIVEMRSKNAYETAMMAVRMRDMLKDWLDEHGKYKKNAKGELVVDKMDRPVLNEEKANIRELESASKLNQTIYETLYHTLGPDIKEEDPHKVVWAIPIDEGVKQMTFEELCEHEKLINQCKAQYDLEGEWDE